MAYIEANMAGNLSKALKKEGDAVAEGEDVAILESMKMEIPIKAKKSGTVKKVVTREGQFVNEGDALYELE